VGLKGKRLKAEIIAVGTELLSGQIVDTNLAYMAQQLTTIGLDLHYKSTVGDNLERIKSTLRNAMGRSDFIGPEAKSVKCPPGTFVFAPEGVIHGVANASRTEEVVLVFAYGGVPSKEAARIVFIDDSGNEYPPKDWDREE
jgi:hypothetical protein